MDINRGNMNALFAGFKSNFQEGMGMADKSYLRFTTTVKSTHASEIFPFLERFGGMREWIGDRQIKSVASHKYTIVNDEFEDTVGVKRNDIEDDSYGLYKPILEDLGFNAEDLWRELAEAALSGGFAAEWIDELAFFSDTRTYGENTIANLGSAALSATAFNAAQTAMMQYKGHNGKYLGVKPDLLVVGPSNRGTAFDILKNELVIKTSGSNAGVIQNQNAFEGTVDYLVVDSLGSEWYLASTKRPLKPVGVQQRVMPTLTKMDQETDENVFMKSQIIYGTRARGAGFLTFPHLIYASDPS